jgi:hypothetical protein
LAKAIAPMYEHWEAANSAVGQCSEDAVQFTVAELTIGSPPPQGINVIDTDVITVLLQGSSTAFFSRLLANIGGSVSNDVAFAFRLTTKIRQHAAMIDRTIFFDICLNF